MQRRTFLTTAANLPFALKAAAKAVAAPAGTPIAARYRLTRDRVLHGTGPSYTPDFLLEDITATPGRRFTNFSGDVSGRWVGALAVASSTYGDTFPTLAPTVQRILALQHPEGYFGKTFHFDHPNDNDLALLWGNGRLLIGLMEYHALTHDPATLASAKKLGDFLVRIGPRYNSQAMADEFGASHFASSYICWTQQTEGLTALFAATQDPRYSGLCKEIAHRIERRPADHVHGYLCSLRGVMDLHALTRDPDLLTLVEREWNSVLTSNDVLLTGGVPEAWSPKRARTEGCAECDWLRLNLQLWQATGQAKYLDMAERTLFNEFAMNQFATGDFGHGELDPDGVTNFLRVRAWWCCTLHGMRAFADVSRSIIRLDDAQATFALPIDGAHTSDSLALTSTSTLATDGAVTLHIRKASGQTLAIRQPAWAQSIRVTRNGNRLSGTTVPGLKPGDAITITYTMSHRNAPWASSGDAFWYGPWLLGAASQVNPGYFNELQHRNRINPASLTPTPPPTPKPTTAPFRVPAAAATLQYLPAEFPEQPQKVELRAVAEQTAMPSTPWQLTFSLKT